MSEPAGHPRARAGFRDLVERLALRGVLGTLGALPLPVTTLLGRGLGRLAYLVLGKRRHIAEANLALVWTDRASAARRREITRRSFESLGLLLADFARLHKRDELLDRIEYDGWDEYVSASDRGHGVLLLGAHFGSWEVLAAAQAARGRPMSFVVRPADNPLVEDLVREVRELGGNHVIDKRNALRECLRRLRAGETVGILIDQHVPADRGEPTVLLGQPVFTTPVLATLALRTDAAVLPAFAVRIGRGRHRIVFGKEIVIARSEDQAHDIREATQRCLDVVAGFIEEHPDHWLWAHRRFRSDSQARFTDGMAADRAEAERTSKVPER